MLPLRMLGILMLMFLLCDADSSCPDDTNPLTLDPPEVVGEYGETVFVNCSSSEEYHDGISLKLGNTKNNTDDNFVSGPLSLSDWSVKAECRIKLSETLECSRELGITIYKIPDNVTVSASEGGPMVEGREYLLVCGITNVAPVQNLTVTWYRDNEKLSTETFSGATVTPVNEFSTLTVTADRRHNGAHFDCETELHLGPELNLRTRTSLPYTADVHYGPLIKSCSGSFSGLEDKFSLNMLPCRADGNPPPTIQWYYQSEKINADELLSRSQSGEYTAVFENGIGRSNSSINITIEYGPEFSCNDRYEVKEGDFSQTPCQPEGLPQPDITWLKDGKEIPTPQRWTRLDSGNYSLRATNKHGAATHALSLDVLYAPELLNPEAAYVTVVEGENVTLTCEARGNPPPVFTWTSKGMNISESTSDLTITQATISATYRCTATNHIGKVTKEISVRVVRRQLSPPMNTPEPPAETDCPLILTPAEVVVRFGDPVSVSCNISSATDDFLGMGWEAAIGGKVFENTSSLTWTVEKVEAWDIKPQCYMTRRNGKRCSMTPVVTVYKTPDTVTVSASDGGLMVEGTEYVLDCGITNVAPVQNLTVTWYRDNEKLSMKIFNGTTVTPVDVSSTLRATADRRHNGARFTCEAELHLGPELNLTTTSPPYSAVMLYAPLIKSCSGSFSGLEDKFSLNMLPCRADGNPPPTIQWYYRNQEIDADELLSRNDSGEYTAVFRNAIARRHSSINITIEYAPEFSCNDRYEVKEDSSFQTLCEPEGLPEPNITWLKDGKEIPTPQRWTRRDSGHYSLRATNKHGAATHRLYLDVLYCPLILTPAEVVVRFGDPVSVNCSIASNTNDSVGMGWEAAFGGTGSETTSSLTWRVEKVEAWNMKPQCYMTRRNGKQCFMTPVVTVYKTPDTVTVSPSDGGLMVEGSEYVLDCGITNVAPVQNLTVTWYRDNEKLSTETFNGTTVSPVDVSSTLRVTADRRHNGARFRCEAELHLGPELILTNTSSLPYTADVHYGPLIKSCSGSFPGEEGKFSLNKLPCRADGNPPPTIQWYYRNQEINADELLSRSQSGEYTAVFENGIGRSNSSIDITIEYGPSFACNDRYEVKEGDSFQTPCQPEGLPQPDITWLKDGEEIPTPQRWTRRDSGHYSLRATNKHGTATHRLSLDVLYAPVFKEGNSTEAVISGGNVTLPCSAEGNPPPQIQWYYESMLNVIQTPNVILTETTGWHQRNITITGATSTNAGVYNCTATNKVGAVTRAVTLAVKDKSGGIPPLFVWLLVALLLLLLIIIIVMCVRSRKNKHGQYNFVPSRATDGLDVPMTPTSNGVKA